MQFCKWPNYNREFLRDPQTFLRVFSSVPLKDKHHNEVDSVFWDDNIEKEERRDKGQGLAADSQGHSMVTMLEQSKYSTIQLFQKLMGTVKAKSQRIIRVSKHSAWYGLQKLFH